LIDLRRFGNISAISRRVSCYDLTETFSFEGLCFTNGPYSFSKINDKINNLPAVTFYSSFVSLFLSLFRWLAWAGLFPKMH
jgi:hypothetical protein